MRPSKSWMPGASRLDELQGILASAPYPSRDPQTNIADIAAQIAANRQGANGLLQFVQDYTWPRVSAYMEFIQDAAAQKMRKALRALPDGRRSFVDHLDDGSPIALALTVTGDTATLDFTGTGGVLRSNLNANPAIVTAAVMYCLRCLIDEDIPLNQGVLAPITLLLPECLLNPPAGETPALSPAMVGGNVETSQRVVDVILGALGVAAASQGTMNNFLFGNDQFGYYETICGGAGAAPRPRRRCCPHPYDQYTTHRSRSARESFSCPPSPLRHPPKLRWTRPSSGRKRCCTRDRVLGVTFGLTAHATSWKVRALRIAGRASREPRQKSTHHPNGSARTAGGRQPRSFAGRHSSYRDSGRWGLGSPSGRGRYARSHSCTPREFVTTTQRMRRSIHQGSYEG